MKKIVWIARHGEDSYNTENLLNGHANTELTPLGIEQAHKLGEKLKEEKVKRIYSSPLNRAITTARIVAEYTTKTEPVILEELIERDYGLLTGSPVSDIPLRCSNLLWVGKVNYPIFGEGLNLEPLEAVEMRAKTVIDKINSDQDEGPILIVCHRELGKVLWCVANGYSWQEGLPVAPSFPNTEVLELVLK